MLWQSTSLGNFDLSPSLVEPSSTGGLLQWRIFIPSLPLIKLCPGSNARLSRAQCWSVWQWSTPLESSLERNNELTEVTISSASSSGSLKEWTGGGLLLSFVIIIFPTQDRASLWREQVGHLGRVPPFDRGDPWLRRQSQDCLEQGRPGEDGDWNAHLNVQINEDMNLTHSEQVDHQELMRVYGALMWSISKVRHFRPQGKAHISSHHDLFLKGDQCARVSENLRRLFLGPAAQARSLSSPFRKRAPESFWWPSRSSKVRQIQHHQGVKTYEDLQLIWRKVCCHAEIERLYQEGSPGQNPRLHHRQSEGRHAKTVWQGEKEKGIDKEFACFAQENPGKG